MNSLKQRILKAFNLTHDFYNSINEDWLKLKIPDLPSNTIGEQAYCIIGARESYLKALKAGSWVGFDCTLRDSYIKTEVINKMEETYADFEAFLRDSNAAEISTDLLIDLLEHEVQHHGQLIRYAYSNKISFPKSWNMRYTV